MTQKGWERLLAQSDNGLKTYLMSIKGNTAFMIGYTASLQGSFTGFKKVSSAITQYNALSESGIEEQNELATAVGATNSKLGNYLSGLNGAKASMGGYVKSLIGATLRTIRLQAVTIALNTALSFGISFIVSGVVSAISEWIHKTENMIKASDEALSKIKSINDELKTNQKTVSDSAEQFAELSQGVDQLTGKNISLSTEDYEEFLTLSNQLAEIFPSLSRVYDENGNAIVQLSGNVDVIVDSLQNLIEAERELKSREIADELPTVFKGVKAQSDEYEDELGKLEAQRSNYISALDTLNKSTFDKNYYEIISEDAEEYAQMVADYTKILEDAGVDFKRFDEQYQSFDKFDSNGNPIFTHKTTLEIIDPDNNFAEIEKDIQVKTRELAKQYDKEINGLTEEINATNTKNKSNWSSLNSSLFAWLSTDDSFKIMDDTAQAVVQNMINNLDWNSLSFDSWEDARKYIQDNILSLFDSSDGKDIITKIQIVLDAQTSFNNDDISVGEYKDKLNEFLPLIEGLDSETKKSILLLFGIQTDENGNAEPSNIDGMIDKVKEKLPDELKERVGELTFDELQIAANLKISEEEIKSELKSLGEGGNVDLTVRPTIDASQLNEKGWDASEGTATVFTSTYNNESGTVAVNFTPIIADPKTGEFRGVLTPEQLDKYAMDVINGTKKDIYNLQIGAKFVGDDAISQAIDATKDIHLLQEYLYVDDGTIQSWDDFKNRIEEVKNLSSDIETSFNGTSSISDSVKQIATQLEPQFAKLGEAYQNIFTADGFTLDNVDNSMLEGLRESFAEIEEDVGVAFDAEQLNSFFDTLTNGESTSEQVQQSFNDLATAYFYSTDTLANLNEETADAITKQLEELGVQNAAEVVTEALAIKTDSLALEKEYLAKAGYDVASATDAEINRLIAEQLAAGNCSQELVRLQVKKLLVNNTKIDLSSDITQIINLARAAGVGVNALAKLESARRVRALRESGANIPDTAYNANANIDVNDIFADIDNFKLGLGFSPTPTPSPTKTPSSGNDKDKDKEPSKETFDLIEILISRIERSISRLDSVLGSVYKKWSVRNTALSDELTAITDEISKQEKGYKRYIKQADSVGLSNDWKKKIKNGEVDIKTIDTTSDEGKALAEKIKDYQTWYEKALACKDAIEQLHEKESELYKTKFDNVVKQFDDSLSMIEHRKNMVDASISQSEEKGYITNIRYYQTLKDIEKENIASLQQEKKKLTQSLNEAFKSGKIKEGSEAWYEMKKQINDVELAIEEANTALIKYDNSIRDIQWEVFDLIQEKISHITSESDFLIDLMGNDKLYKDNGQLTDKGTSTMGLHGLNYNVDMTQADKYKQEIDDIDRKLASGIYDKNDQNVIKRRQELLELQREMILAANEEKMAIVDMVREGIEIELDALKELIDAYTEALDSQKDLYDYQKNVKDQVKEIASLEKQMSALAGDTSEENKAKLQQLKVSLEDARENLEETEYDRYISDQKKLLDDIYNEYEEILNKRLDDVDQLLSDMIKEINKNADAINKTISESAKSVGATISADMTNIWENNDSSSIISKYGEQFANSISGITSIITSIDSSLKVVAGLLSNSGTVASGSGGSSSSSGSASSSSNSGAGSGGKGNMSVTFNSLETLDGKKLDPALLNVKDFIAHLKKKKLTSKELKSHSSLFQYIYKKSNGRAITDADTLSLGKILDVKDLPKKPSGLKSKHRNSILKKLKAVGYKKGTKNVPDDRFAWTQENGGSEVIIRPSDGAILTPLAKNDLVFNAAATSNLYDFMNSPNSFIQDKINGANPVNVSPVLRNVGGDSLDVHLENMNITLPNVKNYEELISKLQKDDHVENMVRNLATIKSYKREPMQKYSMK